MNLINHYLLNDGCLNNSFDFAIISSPIKRNTNPHFYSILKNPIYFYLPKSVISDIYQNDYEEYIANYEIDLEEHIELLQFFDNLDTLCINKTILNVNKFNRGLLGFI